MVLLGDEAMRTSATEGEMLDRSGVQSSLRRHFSLSNENAATKPHEQGITEVMADIYSRIAEPLSDDTLRRWPGMLLRHDRGLKTIGVCRRNGEAIFWLGVGSSVIAYASVFLMAAFGFAIRAEFDADAKRIKLLMSSAAAKTTAATRTIEGLCSDSRLRPQAKRR